MIPLTLDEIVNVIGGRPLRTLPPMTVPRVSTDSRTCGRGDLFFALRGPRFDGHGFVDSALERGACAAVVDRAAADAAGPRVMVGDTVAALGRLGAFHRQQRSIPVIAVTGSSGKTTTQRMIHHVLSQKLRGKAAPSSFNNAIGVPLTLLSADSRDAYLVVEIGSNAPGEVAALAELVSPTIGVITSIGAAHLEKLGDVRGVANEKLSLLDHVRPGGLAVLNADMPFANEAAAHRERLTVLTYGTTETADVRVTHIDSKVTETRFKINGKHVVLLRLAGAHNALNATAAFAVCRRLQIDAETIVAALATFDPPPMRMEVLRAGELTVIDDSYNANPLSVGAAIEVLQVAEGVRRVFVAGDMLELGDDATEWHERIGRQAAEAGIEMLVTVGRYSDAMIRGARSGNREMEVVGCADALDAAEVLVHRLTGTEVVLVKGSRRVGLERVVSKLNEVFKVTVGSAV